MVCSPDQTRPSLTQIFGQILLDDILNDVRISSAFPKALEAGEMSMEVLCVCRIISAGSPFEKQQYYEGTQGTAHTLVIHCEKLRRGSLRISLTREAGSTVTSPASPITRAAVPGFSRNQTSSIGRAFTTKCALAGVSVNSKAFLGLR